MIDAHAHLVTPDTAAFPPAPVGGGDVSAAAMENHLTVEMLVGDMQRLGVERAVVVQRVHVYGYDNAYVLHAAAFAPERLAAVACIDATASDCGRVAETVLAAGARGLRFSTVTKDPADMTWFAGPEALRVWTVAGRAGASICLHVFRWNRDAAVAALVPILGRFPDVSVILDHVGNPTSEEAGFGLDAVAALVPFAQLYVKVSTINFEYVRKAGGSIAAFTSAVVDRFGADRVMWGSDVAQSAGRYDTFVADATSATADLSAPDRATVLGGTAAAVYFCS